MLRVLTLAGAAITPHLPALAALRIRVFRDFPYLYDGDLAYEEAYLRTYVDAPEAAVILAMDGETVVGASTCLPLARETANIQKPCIEAGWSVAEVFYFGESVLDYAYRNRGIGVRFFEARENCARQAGAKVTAFCAVERPSDHPMRPAAYVPLDGFWERRGYARQVFSCVMSWRDVGEAAQSEKTLTFWAKRL